ncbi:MAG TPA: hypothetical protein VGD56_16595, partial [Gemmatirosa sp.]
MTSRPRSPARRARLTGACAAAAAILTVPYAARAQSAPPRDFPFHQTVSATPLFIPLGNFSAEYERKLGVRGFTAAVAGTYNTTTQLYPRRDRWVLGRVMYYPGGVALDGFAVGVSVGAHRAERRYREDPAVVLAHDGGATIGA